MESKIILLSLFGKDTENNRILKKQNLMQFNKIECMKKKSMIL